MKQSHIDRAVARATGESVYAIRRRGFSIVKPDEGDPDAEAFDLPPNIIDWDALEAERSFSAA